MSRLVELDATEPKKLDESDLDPEKGDIAVCQCGLSDDFPFCDGSHRVTRSESEEVCYQYIERNGDMGRREIEQVVYTTEESDESDE